MSLFKRKPDPAPPPPDVASFGPLDWTPERKAILDEFLAPSASARVSDNGRDIDVTLAGWGIGGHAGSLRAVGWGIDRTVAVQWDGDTYTTTIEGGAEEVIAKIDRKSERIAPVVPLGR
jgi:hypothetical protein